MADRCAAGGKPTPRRRRYLWEVNAGLHCSLVGTCLTLADLRRIRARLKIGAAENATEFQLHGHFVACASRPGPVAKKMQQLLDRRYAPAIRKFSAVDAAGLGELWKRSVEEGDIPGPYWALLSHPAADAALSMRAYGQVHMLSHLVGASNRADMRRLMKLEDERDALASALAAAKQRLAAQERAESAMLAEHAAEVRCLTAQLSAAACLSKRLQAVEDRVSEFERGDAYQALLKEAEIRQAALAEADRIAHEHEELANRLLEENTRLHEAVAALEASSRALSAECEAIEWMLHHHLSGVAPDEAIQDGAMLERREAAVALCGRRIVYVGGRTGLIPHFRALVERSGGSFLHHDGGIEEQGTRLDGMLGRCDAVFCAIDCVSHDACRRAKRACRERAAIFVSLRTASLSSFVQGLRELAQGMNDDAPNCARRA